MPVLLSFLRKHLLVGNPEAIALHFSASNVKKRIIMINKMKSARLHLSWFFFVLPLAAVLLVAFRGNGTQAGNLFTKERPDTLYWKISSKKHYEHPVYLLDGKISDDKTIRQYVGAGKIKSVQFLPDEKMTREYGPQYDGIMNFRTNGKEESAVSMPALPSGQQALPGKNAEGGYVYINMPNALKVDVEGIPFDKLEARISDGIIAKKRDYFLLQPVTPGKNIDVVLYMAAEGGLKQLDTHTYRSVLPDDAAPANT
jgi:hypothetical protein